MKLYKLIVNEEQLKIIQKALESYSRLGTGQLETVLFNLGFSTAAPFKHNIQNLHSNEVKDAVEKIKFKLFNLSFKAANGIRSSLVNEEFKVCYDLFNAIKVKLNSNDNISTYCNEVSKNGLIEIEVCPDEEI